MHNTERGEKVSGQWGRDPMTDDEVVAEAIERSARLESTVRLPRPTQGQINLLLGASDDVDAIQGDDGRVVGWDFLGKRDRKWSVTAYDKDGTSNSQRKT